MRYNIREASQEDFPAILSLIRELAEYERSPDMVTNTVNQMNAEKDLFRCYVAETDQGLIVGMALFFFAYFTWVGKSLYLEDIIVTRDYRQHQIGTALLDKVMQTAKEESCRRVRWQVLDWNEPAISFYRKCGAEINGEWLNCTFDEEGIEKFGL